MYKYFTEKIENLDELRKQYTKLMKKYHPDNGGTDEQASAINNEYEQIFKALKNGERFSGQDSKKYEKKYDWKVDKNIREAIEKIIHLNVVIEVCGSWVWVSGNTFDVKDELKTSGYKYSKNKKMWYFTMDSFRHGKKALKMDEIRAKYGSTVVETEKQERLEA